MSIKSLIEDADFLWEHNRYESAFLIALTAVAATSRLRFQDRKLKNDREAFVEFMQSFMQGRLGAEFRGELYYVEVIFYKFLRCELVHEGELPCDIEFITSTNPDTLTIRAGGKLLLSDNWFFYLSNGVKNAPENADIFVTE
jgi:hypothetical protein